jgi:hypothetical protein
MADSSITIDLHLPTGKLLICVPHNEDKDEPITCILQTKLGRRLDRMLLHPGENRIDTHRFNERNLVIRVETKFETVVKELDTVG